MGAWGGSGGPCRAIRKHWIYWNFITTEDWFGLEGTFKRSRCIPCHGQGHLHCARELQPGLGAFRVQGQPQQCSAQALVACMRSSFLPGGDQGQSQCSSGHSLGRAAAVGAQRGAVLLSSQQFLLLRAGEALVEKDTAIPGFGMCQRLRNVFHRSGIIISSSAGWCLLSTLRRPSPT